MVSEKMRYTLFGGNIATEIEQAYVRLIMFTIAAIYSIFADKYYVINNNELVIYVYIFIAYLVGFATLFVVVYLPQLRPFTRKFHLIFDGVMGMTAFLILGEYASPMFFVYLFLAIGYGMRYSLNYLIVGLVLGVLLHTFGVLYSDYNPAWPELSKDYVLIIALSVYVGVLIKRLNNAYKETERALEKAETANHVKTMFLANVSHDLRTPLVGVGTAVELLDKKDWSNENKSLLKTISASANVLEQQINQILEFAKSESVGLEVEKEPVALKQLLEDCKTILIPQASKKKISIVFDCHAPVCIESYDAGLRKIILNIAGNAIKFTDEGEVHVNVSYISGRLWFDIKDTGIGIPGDKLSTIFEPFTQADGSITRKYGGTGLGTAITKQLVDELGGSISLTSKEGVGTHVSIEIPAAKLDDDRCRQSVVFDKNTLEANREARLLVADDNSTNRHIIELVLKKGGFHNYDVVSDGAQALNKMLKVEYDLVILDRHMPEMDGGAALSAYKAKSKKPVKAIFLTADQTADAYSEYEKVGFDAFVKKPFKPDELLGVINELLTAV